MSDGIEAEDHSRTAYFIDRSTHCDPAGGNVKLNLTLWCTGPTLSNLIAHHSGNSTG
nr:hypothetical protein [Candidatus Brachybacter algidus]